MGTLARNGLNGENESSGPLEEIGCALWLAVNKATACKFT